MFIIDGLLSNRGNQDRSRVNLHEKWGVTREQLVAAAKEVGVSVAAIAKKLGKNSRLSR